ncbi:hypothetical protein DLM45_03600 [Hyphomicrobium methylovorum]|uniref:hypothetical protein n=1 Tax=Hyphomicrobium methylovorum TaxID=84 RepID=UPI0015E6695D|nr:hypothetical protein [Hyphomicrobium methylovorum]MBA2125308.1 hypothetical protein [Hyphomicrobium methylovorum]
MQLKDQINELRIWTGPIIWLLAILAAAATLLVGADFLRTKNANTNIQALLDGKDVEIQPARAESEEVLARINELLRRDRLDEAQTLYSSSETRISIDVRALALFNIANERTRQATEFVRKGDIDRGTALVNVAKSEYRMALKLKPDDWDARYNLDVAMRIVRDLPQADNLPDDEQQTPKKLWTDLPGVPKGLP